MYGEFLLVLGTKNFMNGGRTFLDKGYYRIEAKRIEIEFLLQHIL